MFYSWHGDGLFEPFDMYVLSLSWTSLTSVKENIVRKRVFLPTNIINAKVCKDEYMDACL